MRNKNSAGKAVDPQNVTTNELQDPMSGYTSADALDTEVCSTGQTHESDSLRDPMRGQADEGQIVEDGTPAAGRQQAHDGVDLSLIHI